MILSSISDDVGEVLKDTGVATKTALQIN